MSTPRTHKRTVRVRIGDALAKTADTIRGESPRRTSYRGPAAPAAPVAVVTPEPSPPAPVPVVVTPARPAAPRPASVHVAATSPVPPAPSMATIARDEPALGEPTPSEPAVHPVVTSAASYEKDSWLTVLLVGAGIVVGFLIALGTYSWVIYEKWDDGNLLRIFAGYFFVVVYVIMWVVALGLLGLCIGRKVTNTRVREDRTTRLTRPRQA